MLSVSCAIIESEGKILAAQRGVNMRLPFKWEFPGGKVEEGESPEMCILREIQEELAIKVEIVEREAEVYHDYSDFKICLIPFRCKKVGGTIQLKEHHCIHWYSPNELKSLDWSDADIEVMKQYISKYYPTA